MLLDVSEDLIDVVPITERGERGNVFIMARGSERAWAVAHAAELVAAGYVKLLVTDHVRTRVVGDRRRGRRNPPPLHSARHPGVRQ